MLHRHLTHSTVAKYPSRWQTSMCFRGDDTEPDIWLTVENGKYVPAPPIVYMPGLRQIQDRLHRKASHRTPPPTSRNDVVRLPLSSMMPITNSRWLVPAPQAPATDSIPASSTKPPPDISTPELTLPTVIDQTARVAAPSLNKESAEAPKVPKRRSGGPSEEPPDAFQGNQREEQPVKPISASGGAHGSDDRAASDSSYATPSSPSNSSFSLRSILKKPSTSTMENTESGAGAEIGRPTDEENGQKAPRLKIKKVVSFAEDMAASAAASPPEGEIASQVTAAKEGAAIARKIVERERAQREACSYVRTGQKS